MQIPTSAGNVLKRIEEHEKSVHPHFIQIQHYDPGKYYPDTLAPLSPAAARGLGLSDTVDYLTMKDMAGTRQWYRDKAAKYLKH